MKYMYKEKLKSLRKEKNISQKIIANILEIAEITYTNYENEYYVMPLNYLNIVSDYFNVSIDYLLGLNDEKNYGNNFKNINSLTIGKRLKEFRKENNLTQVKLAEVLNTVQPVIANYEKGKNIIATPFLYTICKKYNVSADYLLGKIDKPKYFK